MSDNKERVEAIPSKNVFIVHGRDFKPVVELKSIVLELGYNPIVLHEQPSGSRTIVEKLEKYSKVTYVFVLLTPDDAGYCQYEKRILSEDYARKITLKLQKLRALANKAQDMPDIAGALKGFMYVLQGRARQNVVFEFGYFAGLLGRDRVCCLYKGDVELPSDMDGVVYVPFKTSVNECREKIVSELEAAQLETLKQKGTEDKSHDNIWLRQKGHSDKLKDIFFKPWLEIIGAYNDKYCKIDALYSEKSGRMVAYIPREPDDLRFYNDAKAHLRDYPELLSDWEDLKGITLRLNEELATLFEDIRLSIKEKIDVAYWCPYIGKGDEPEEYLCPNTFIRRIFDDIAYTIGTGRHAFEIPIVQPTSYGEKTIFSLHWSDISPARSLKREYIELIGVIFRNSIEDEKYVTQFEAFIEKKKNTYDKQVKKVEEDINKIIDSIELENIIKGKCKDCPS